MRFLPRSTPPALARSRWRAVAPLVASVGALVASPACAPPEPETGGGEEALIVPSHCGDAFSGPLTVDSTHDNPNARTTTTKITWVKVGPLGEDVAVRIAIPETGRYVGPIFPPPGLGARGSMPIVLDTPEFMGDETWDNFANSMGMVLAHNIGAIALDFLKPGMNQMEAPLDGVVTFVTVCSDGVVDGGAETSRRYMRAVAEFATGARTDRWGNHITDLAPDADPSNVGVYASSHTGMLALRAFAEYGLGDVEYFVGWENPLSDVHLTGELGRLVEDPLWVSNDLDDHAYGTTVGAVRGFEPGDYDDTLIRPDHQFLRVVDGHLPQICDRAPAPTDCYQTDGTGGIFLGRGSRRSVMSVGLTLRTCQALCAGPCTAGTGASSPLCPNWPSSMAPLSEVNEWERRAMIGAVIDGNGALASFDHFPDIAAAREGATLHAMLVFHQYDHKAGEPTKPKIQQAYRGLHDRAGAWVRLNPDQAYLGWALTIRSDLLVPRHYSFPDNRANTEPGAISFVDGWTTSELDGWSVVVPQNAVYPPDHDDPNHEQEDHYARFKELTKLAALAEMMDRTRSNTWSPNLPEVIYASCSTSDCPGLAPPP